MQISRGKFDRLPRAPAESTALASVERTLRIRARSSDQDCLIFGFCPSGRGFASALLSDGPSRQPPLRLASPLSHQTWAEDFHLQAVKHARHTRSRGRKERVHRSLENRQERGFPPLPQATVRDGGTQQECHPCSWLTLLPMFPVAHLLHTSVCGHKGRATPCGRCRRVGLAEAPPVEGRAHPVPRSPAAERPC